MVAQASKKLTDKLVIKAAGSPVKISAFETDDLGLEADSISDPYRTYLIHSWEKQQNKTHKSLSEYISALGHHQLISQGISLQAFKVFIVHVPLNTSELASILNVSDKTISRNKSAHGGGKLSVRESDQLWRLAEVLDEATELLGTKAAASMWLRQPAIALDGQKPISLLSTSVGAEAVLELIGRLKYGVYS